MIENLKEPEQIEIITNLRRYFNDNEQSMITWLCTKDRSFRNRPPIDLLLTKDYSYFTQFRQS